MKKEREMGMISFTTEAGGCGHLFSSWLHHSTISRHMSKFDVAALREHDSQCSSASWHLPTHLPCPIPVPSSRVLNNFIPFPCFRSLSLLQNHIPRGMVRLPHFIGHEALKLTITRWLICCVAVSFILPLDSHLLSKRCK